MSVEVTQSLPFVSRQRSWKKKSWKQTIKMRVASCFLAVVHPHSQPRAPHHSIIRRLHGNAVVAPEKQVLKNLK